MAGKYITKNEEETKQVAGRLAKKLTGQEIILLSGNLGAGKTVFVRGLVEALGSTRKVTSPTFSLMNIYPVGQRGIDSVVHLDAYRVSGKDLLDIGLVESIERPDTVVVIEWAPKIEPFLKGLANQIHVSIEPGKTPSQRKIIIT